MKSISGTILLLVLSSVVSQATAQQSNVGYYHKIADDGIHATYQLVWHAYIPGAEHEPPHPDEFHIPPSSGGGGSCDPNINECPIINGMFDPFLRGTTELPPVVVTVSRPTSRMWAIPYLSFQGGGGSGGGGCGSAGCGMRGIHILDLDMGDQQAQPCTSSDFSQLPSDLAQLIKDFMNSDAARDLWTSSNPTGTITRVEQGGLLVKIDGSYEWRRAGASGSGVTIVSQSCNNINMAGSPSLIDNNTIDVHTHPTYPYSQMEVLCGGGGIGPTPPGGPTPPDFQAVSGMRGGIVMDGNQIYFYDSSGTSSVVEIERCGY